MYTKELEYEFFSHILTVFYKSALIRYFHESYMIFLQRRFSIAAINIAADLPLFGCLQYYPQKLKSWLTFAEIGLYNIMC